MQRMLREQVSAYLVAGLQTPSTGQGWVAQTELLTGSASPVGLGGLLSPWTRTHLHALLPSLAPGMLSGQQAKAWHHLPGWHPPSATPGLGFRHLALTHLSQSHSAAISYVPWLMQPRSKTPTTCNPRLQRLGFEANPTVSQCRSLLCPMGDATKKQDATSEALDMKH